MKFNFGRGSIPHPLGELTVLSVISSWIFWRRGGEREMGRGKVKGRERRGVKEREEEKGRE